MHRGSNSLYLPFRRTHPISLSFAIKQYISSKYDQHPDMFTRDLEKIDQIRSDAVNVREPHVSGVRKLLVYSAQLVWLSGKFPIDVSLHFHLKYAFEADGIQIGVDFTWYTALGYNTQRPGLFLSLVHQLA